PLAPKTGPRPAEAHPRPWRESADPHDERRLGKSEGGRRADRGGIRLSAQALRYTRTGPSRRPRHRVCERWLSSIEGPTLAPAHTTCRSRSGARRSRWARRSLFIGHDSPGGRGCRRHLVKRDHLTVSAQHPAEELAERRVLLDGRERGRELGLRGTCVEAAERPLAGPRIAGDAARPGV